MSYQPTTPQEKRLTLVFKALSDPNRLRMFDLLTFNDLSNSELKAEIGLSQNLLSHHLNILAAAGLITVHASIGDARRRYYAANLDAVAGVQGWLGQHAPISGRPLPALSRRRRVLFICLRRAARALMAEAIAQHIAPGALEAYSAGIEPASAPQTLAAQVLAEHGLAIDTSGGLTLAEAESMAFDTVITVCDHVHERIDRDRLHTAEYLHWSLVDPAELADDAAGQLDETRQLYTRLAQRITVYVQRLAEQERGGRSPA